MIIENFRNATGNEASGWANEGRGKLALPPQHLASPPQARLPKQATHTSAEHALLDHIVAYIQAAQPLFARSLIIDYYIALKTYPLVLLAGADTETVAELARLFAEAVVGAGSAQIAQFSGAAWSQASVEDGYYRSLHDRFSSLRCQSIAQEAAEACNIGKAYFACFDSLPLAALESQLASLGMLDGTCNVAVTAVLEPGDIPAALVRFQQAGLIQVRGSAVPRHVEQVPPPVGWQRIWLRAVAAQASPTGDCDDDIRGALIERLRKHATYSRLLWRSGLTSGSVGYDAMARFVANSVDMNGIGLYEPSDLLRNYTVALSAYIAQRCLLPPMAHAPAWRAPAQAAA